ncbi:MAG: DUF4411 family protein [Alphaproteobacteria bacterium]
MQPYQRVALHSSRKFSLGVSDKETQKAFLRVVAFVQDGEWEKSGKDQFLAKADPWLVAKAIATGATVVTHEKPNDDAKRRVPLPNVCQKFSVPYLDVYTLLDLKNAVFVEAEEPWS